jgi:hypothetical protein
MVNRKGAPFRDASQVEAHIDGSHDGAHREESGEDHREQIVENAEEMEPADDTTPASKLDDESVTVAVGVDDDGEVVVEEMDMRSALITVSHAAVGSDAE